MTTDGHDIGPQSTEWEHQLEKHNIIPKKRKMKTNDDIDTEIMWQQKANDPYDDKTLADLDELEDDIEQQKLHELRQQRMAQLKAKAKFDKFGRITPISKAEYTKEVTESSLSQPVICCLFVFGQEESQIMLKCLEQLADKFKAVKFVKIVGQQCIANYSDNLCPTLVIYKDGDRIEDIKGLDHFGGKKVINAHILEWELAENTSIWKSTLEHNPRKFKLRKIGRKYEDNVEDYDSDSLDLD